MGNPTNTGEYDEYDYKHDCNRPLVGCDYPNCSCDVDDDEISHKEKQAIEEILRQMEETDYENLDVEEFTK